MKQVITALTLSGAIALGAAACGGGSGKPAAVTPTTNGATTSTTIDVAHLSQKVLSFLNAGNAAIIRDENIKNLNTAAAHVSRDFSAAANDLQALSYPSADQGDAKALVAILQKLSVDAGQLALATEVSVQQSLLSSILSDEGTERGDSNALRQDLGLPPASSRAAGGV